jgi:hypothetical protein
MYGDLLTDMSMRVGVTDICRIYNEDNMLSVFCLMVWLIDAKLPYRRRAASLKTIT